MSDDYDTRYDYLPEPLREAPRAFDTWSKKQLLAEQDASTPDHPALPLHNEQALNGILSNEKLWCFGHQYQKDVQEFRYSLEIARRVIKEVGETDDGPTYWFCACLLDMLDNNSFTDTLSFISLASAVTPTTPSNGGNTGTAGVASRSGLHRPCSRHRKASLNEQANENLYVGRVLYGDAAHSSRHRSVVSEAARIASRVAWANRPMSDTVKPSDYFSAVAREVIASQLIWNCLTAKHENFSNEREVRYIIMGIISKFDLHRKHFNGKAYVEAPLPLKTIGSIKEILVGPGAPAGAEAMVEAFLKANGYPEAIPVRCSGAAL